jgi:hypothetical protein
VPEPHISPVVDLTQEETLHGLAERVVAVESLVFLAKQLEFLHGYLEHLQGGSSFLQQFFSQVCEPLTEVCEEHIRSNTWNFTLGPEERLFWEVRECALNVRVVRIEGFFTLGGQ